MPSNSCGDKLMARIEIIAGLGTGKTSLAKLLEGKGFVHIEEAFEDNPFLKQLYEDKQQSWLEYGVTNLMIHFNQARKNIKPDTDYVFDFSTVLDRAYAQAHLDINAISKKELKAYEHLDKVVREQAPDIDLRIHLKCSPDAQKKRILSRGREYEKGVSLDFLKMMDKYTQKYISQCNDGAKVLVIDTEKYNYVDNPEHIKIVLDKIYQALDENNVAIKSKPTPTLKK